MLFLFFLQGDKESLRLVFEPGLWQSMCHLWMPDRPLAESLCKCMCVGCVTVCMWVCMHIYSVFVSGTDSWIWMGLNVLGMKKNSRTWIEFPSSERPPCAKAYKDLTGAKGMTEDEMAEWHHWLDGRESEWTLGVGYGQGGLACCDSWGRKQLDMTEWLNWTELKVHRGKY